MSNKLALSVLLDEVVGGEAFSRALDRRRLMLKGVGESRVILQRLGQ